MKLPMPPSTNNLFVNVPKRGRVPSGRYRQWKTAAGLMLNVQRPHRVIGSVRVLIYVPEKTRGDIDNRVKAVLDLLVAHGVIEDDKHVHSLTIARDIHTEPNTLEVFVLRASEKAA
jgi:crossover junction endodeoxyribonuclease RusA